MLQLLKLSAHNSENHRFFFIASVIYNHRYCCLEIALCVNLQLFSHFLHFSLYSAQYNILKMKNLDRTLHTENFN
jgi:hypothetical protein